MAVATDKPELLHAQITALSRLIPLLYLILMGNFWVLAVNFMGKAPDWLSLGVALMMSIACCVRLVQWWRKRRSRRKNFDPAVAASELRRTTRVSILMGSAFSIWAFALFPYGDAQSQMYVGMFITIAMLTSMLCLIHHLPSAVVVAATCGVPLVVIFGMSGISTFVGTAINVTFVTIAVVLVISIQYRDFNRMVDAQKQSLELGNENLRLANLDSLTGLPNRRAFFSHLNEAFAEVQANGNRLALGIIDLDGFKPVNDLYGHATGDKLLVEVAARLSAHISSDTTFLSRLGGDEFAFTIVNAADDDTLITLGEAIAGVLREPFQFPEATVQISGSVGMAVYPEMASTFDLLFERADYAMYHGKSIRRGGAVLFSAEHETQINRDSKIEQALRRANLEQELSVVFQPIVNIRTQSTVGFEALARWTSPILGSVSPGLFIPVAERAGIINLLTQPLLEKALAVAVQWTDAVRLSFNLSAFDLNSVEAVLRIVKIIEGSGFDAQRLDLEITETAFTHDFAQVQRSVEILRQLGCGISLDDFGTGYSSLTRLHALPLTKIKIDRSFVTDMHKSPNSLKIVKSLLALSRDMGLDCVVEGVETKEEMAALRRLGGQMVQGYYCSPPVSSDQVHEFMGEAVLAIGA